MAARVYPELRAADSLMERPGARAERLVLDALAVGFGSDCVIYHNLQWMNYEQNHLRPHETDLVLLDPSRGVLLLEVKGQTIRHDPTRGSWYYDDGGPCKDPFQQAADNLAMLKKRMLAALGVGTLPFPYGFAIVFPESQFTGPERPTWFREHFVFMAGAIGGLPERARDCLSHWNQWDKANPIPGEKGDILRSLFQGVAAKPSASDEQWSKVIRSFQPHIAIGPAEYARIARDEAAIQSLTEQQAELFGQLAYLRRLPVRGVAGSGKTILARTRASALARGGNSVLLLCYNKALAAQNASALKENDRLVTCANFHDFVSLARSRAGLPPFRPSTDADYDTGAPAALLEAVDALERCGRKFQFDEVIVDEGQDFHESWWDAVELLIKENEEGERPLFVFFDPDQNIFNRRTDARGDTILPAGMAKPYPLRRNCRNTKAIVEYLGRTATLRHPIEIRPDAPAGEPPLEFPAEPTADAAFRKAEALVRSWLDGGLSNASIAILTPHTSVIRAHQEIRFDRARIRLTPDASEWKAGQGILLCTQRAFKGLEADAIIIVAKADPGLEYQPADRYVACSRARHRLALAPFQRLG
jgi:hypothetical protein